MDSNDILAAVDAYLQHLQHDRGYADTTIAGYSRDFADACAYLVSRGHKPDIRVVAGTAIQEWLREPTKDGRRRSARSRNRRLAALRGLFRWVQAQGLRANDPTEGIPWSRVRPRDPPSLSERDVGRLVRAARANPSAWHAVRDEAVLVLCVQTGLRLSELTNLDIDQVDMDAAYLRQVRRKGGARRDIVVNREVARVLRAWLPVRKERAPQAERALFVSRQRRRLAPRSVQGLVRRYAEQAGIGIVYPHLLRHVFAYEVQQRGRATMRTAQELMNHANIQTTATYSRSTEADQRAAVRELEELTKPRRRRRRS